MKRLSVILLIVMLVFSGCGGNAKAGDDGTLTELTIWHDKEDAVANVLQAELDKLKPEITVRLEKKSGLTEALKMVGNDPKTAPDFYFFAHDKLGVYAEMGILTPVTDLIDAAALDALLPMTVKAAAYKGQVYQLPIYFETLLFMYNRALMSDDEVPSTTEELYGFMISGAGGKYGFIEQHSTAYYSAGWIHGFGGGIITPDGVPQLNTPETAAALDYHLRFVKHMPGESEYATVNTLFREGRAASTIGGPWFVPTAREAGIDLGLAKMPTVDDTGLPLAPYSGVQGLHVLKVAADNPDKAPAVKAVLNLLLNPGIGVSMAKASGCAPALSECYELEEIKSDAAVMMMRETAENAVPMPNIPEMDIMWNVMSNLLVDVNMRGTDITEAVNNAQQEAEKLIGAMR
jgi:arabinogalactan oligomer/maltooligosaccharide transport system substrate-binding protein